MTNTMYDIGAVPTVVEPRIGYTEQEWQDAKLRGIASDYFQDSMHWPAAILCMKHLLKEHAAAPPRAAMTDEQIDKIIVAQWGTHPSVIFKAHRAFARAVITADRGQG